MPIFLVIMSRVSAIALGLDNPEETLADDIPRTELWVRNMCRERLSAGHTNYHCRNVFYIDEGVEKFSTSQMGKVDDVVSNSCHLAAHFFSRSQVQLDTFAGAARKNTENSCVRLQVSFSWATKLEQVTAATMIPRRSE